MYPGEHPMLRPDRPAVIMAGSGEILTYGELERRSNKLAHLLRANALKRLDHFAIFMENNSRYVECCAAGERAGLYYTCINSYLTPDELAYIVKQRIQNPDHVNGKARCCAGRATAMPNDSALPDRRWRGGRRGRPQSRRGHAELSRGADLG